jgi:hypothetical protein
VWAVVVALKVQQDFKVLKDHKALLVLKVQQDQQEFLVMAAQQVLKAQLDFKVLKDQLVHQVHKEL